jgi:hypothetical protein
MTSTLAPKPDELKIPYGVRHQHVYVPGKTQHGKSTFIHNCAIQDIDHRSGVCVIDGKGNLFKEYILPFIPKHRLNDTFYLDINTPIPLDFMSYDGEREKEKLIGELKFLLLRTVETANIPVIGSNLTDLLYTLFDYNENPNVRPERKATFLDIHEFLEDEERRKEILKGVSDPFLVRKWTVGLPPLVDRNRISSRMTTFVRSKSLRKIFGDPNPALRIVDIVEGRKVLLVKAGPPDEVQSIYATLLISKIRQAIYRRTNLAKRQMIPFYLYCDEFQKFQTSDFDELLSLAGGLGLRLTLAHQYMHQLNAPIWHSIKGNVSTYVVFRVSTEDAGVFQGEIPSMADELVYKRSQRTGEMDWVHRPIPFNTADLAKLPVGRALYRAADGQAYLIDTRSPPPPLKKVNARIAEYIKKRTMAIYGPRTAPGTLGSTNDAAADDIQPITGEIKPVPRHGDEAQSPEGDR